MIITSSVRSSEGLEALRHALVELTARDLLSGLSLQGRAISIIERPGVQTMCTDGRAVYYDPAWLLSHDPKDNAFDLLHEWLHIFGNHCLRRGDRDPRLWNIAADMVVVHQASRIFSDPPHPYPADGVIPAPWSIGLSVEQIYDKLQQEQQQQRQQQQQQQDQEAPEQGQQGAPGEKDGEGTENASPEPTEVEGVPEGYAADLLEPAALSPDEEQSFFSAFIGELVQAKTVMENLGRPPNATVGHRLVELQRDDTPWERLLVGDVVADFGFDVPTYSPPNRRYLPLTLLPSYRSERLKQLVIAVDVSGSVSDAMLKRFGRALQGAVARADEVVLLGFDDRIRSERIIRSSSQISSVRFGSGSHFHTCTKHVFRRIEELQPTSYTILTDLLVSFPETAYPKTIWVTPEQAPQAPWGRQHRMRSTW